MFDRITHDASSQRKAILRGVYDDNVRIRNGLPRAPARGRGHNWRFLAPFAFFVVMVAAGQFLHAWGEPAAAVLALLFPHPQPAKIPPMASASSPLQQLADPAARTLMPGAGESAGGPASSLPGERAPGGEPKPGNASLSLSEQGKAGELIADAQSLVSGPRNIRNLFGLSVKTIVIDAGHGGHDPGTVGEMGTLEKDVTLDVARRLKVKLEQKSGYRIMLVRDEDVFVPIDQRAAFANSQETDLFVSIHVNYLPYTSSNAVQTYYFAVYHVVHTRKLAERENAGSQYSLSQFENVVRNMQDAIKLQESKALAHSIQSTLLNHERNLQQKVLDTGVRAAPFVVLLGVKAPSVLVEIANLRSHQAEQDLHTERYRDEIASYVAAGITDYLNTQPREEAKHDESKSKLANHQ